MAEVTLPARNEIETKYKWNAESVFPTPGGWDAEAARLHGDVGGFKRFQGRLADGPEIVAEALADMQELGRRALRARLLRGHGVRGRHDRRGGAANGTAGPTGLQGQVGSSGRLCRSRAARLGEATLRNGWSRNPKLAYLVTTSTTCFRRQAHVRSAEVEELLGMVVATRSATSSRPTAC